MAVHIVPSIARESSGPSYSVPRLCEALIAAGEHVTLATCDTATRPADPPFVRHFPPGLGPRRLGRNPRLSRWLRTQVRGGRADIVHSHGIWHMCHIHAARAARDRSAHLVVSPHGSLATWALSHGQKLAKRLFWLTLQRRALAGAACFRATSEGEYEDIRRLGFRQPVALIPNGIDLPLSRTKVRTKDRTLLFLGRLHPMKGVDCLIGAWRALQDEFPLWRLVIVGDDASELGTSGYMDELRRLAANRGATRLTFAGELTGAAKWDAYFDASIYVLPSRSENFGVTVAEALAAGTPVITTYQTPWRGLSEHRAGWCIETGTAPLTACLREALSADEEELQRMGLRGRGWMEAEFSWIEIGRRMMETYGWLRGEVSPRPTWVRGD